MTNSTTLEFHAATTQLEALQRAAYAVADLASVEIRPADDGWTCELFARKEGESAEQLRHTFRTEVVDQGLRLAIGRQTEQIRNVVFALAFSRTGLVGEQE